MPRLDDKTINALTDAMQELSKYGDTIAWKYIHKTMSNTLCTLYIPTPYENLGFFALRRKQFQQNITTMQSRLDSVPLMTALLVAMEIGREKVIIEI